MRTRGPSIVVFNVDGNLYATDDDRPLGAGSLYAGKLESMLLQRPAHGLMACAVVVLAQSATRPFFHSKLICIQS